MNLYNNQLFHIYNQGNNHQTIFFEDENYEFFIWKMRAYLLPFGSLVSYCLMPNHFHWQFYVKRVEVDRAKYWQQVDAVEWQRRVKKYGQQAQAVKRKATRGRQHKLIGLNEAIGILLRSYTRAIGKANDRDGSLFRDQTKAKDGWINEVITVRRLNGQLDNRFMPGTGYTHSCFEYIHENPVRAGLVKKATDWIYSSARDYVGLRNGTLCDLELGRKLIREL